MAFSAPRPCAQPGCPNLVRYGRCADHQRKADAADRARRGSAHERGYDARWQRYREQYLLEHPLCVLCRDEDQLVTPATVVDHIKAHKGDHRLFWDPKNHRAVCKPHHDRRVDEGDFGRSAS